MISSIKHNFKNKLINLKLFKSATSFTDIENSLFKIGDNLERGWAFEVFAEAYLKLEIYRPLKNVYPENIIPSKVKKSLKLPPISTNQKGIDGVFETDANDLITYQVKFRKVRTRLSITRKKS